MAEAIGIASGIVGLLTVAAQVAKLSFGIFSDLKEASRTQRQYLQGVSALNDVLFRLDDAAKQAESLSLNVPRPPSLPEAAIKDCGGELQSICDNLQGGIKGLKWLFQEKELKKKVDHLHRYHDIFSGYVSALTLTTTSATYRRVEELGAGFQRMDLKTKKKELTDWIGMAEDTCKPLPNSISGTGQWFLETEQYQTWCRGPATLFWCNGAPGVGKSVIASRVISDLQERRGEPICTTYYFCDHATRKRQDLDSIVKSLLCRLIPQLDTDAVASLTDLKEEVRHKPGAEFVAKMVLLAAKHSPVAIVLDALDELDASSEIVSNLKRFVDGGCRVFLTSRNLPDLKSQLPMTINLSISANPDDVKLFLETRFREEGHDELIRRGKDLMDRIIDKAGGRFLLAHILVGKLLELATLSQMRKSLDSMPSTITEAFESDLERIQAQSPGRRSLAFKLIAWVTHSQRRLKVDELLHALAIEDDEDDFDEDNVPTLAFALRTCVGLVIQGPSDNYIGMVHTTAYEFFQARTEFTNSDIANACLRYLLSSPLRDGPCKDSVEMSRRLEKRPLLLYAARFWGNHIEGPKVEERLVPLIEVLFKDPLLRVGSFQAAHHKETVAASLATELFAAIPTEQTALHVAAYWNLGHTTKLFLQDGSQINAKDSQQWTPLHWACKTATRDRSVIDLLVAAGAEVDAKDSQGWTPLFQLALRGNVEGAKLLFSYGASHVPRDIHGWSPLAWAVATNRRPMVNLILERNRAWLEENKVHSKSRTSQLTYFQARDYSDLYSINDGHVMDLATKNGNQTIFQLLASYDANNVSKIWEPGTFDIPLGNMWRMSDKATLFNGVGDYMYDPLHSASRLEEQTWKSHLLHRAVRDDKLMAVQMLLEVGADVNHQSEPTLYTPLHAAACRQDPHYARLLFENGANASIRNQFGQTPLHLAIINGFVDTVAEMIKWGSEVNEMVRLEDASPEQREDKVGPPEGRSPLILACGLTTSKYDDLRAQRSSAEVEDIQSRMVTLLLANKADINTKDPKGRTALHCAVEARQASLVKTLLMAGADFHMRNGHGETVLHVAAGQADLEVIRLLVDAGSDVTAVDDRGRRMIHCLASGHANSDLADEELWVILHLLQADTPACYNAEYSTVAATPRVSADASTTNSPPTPTHNPFSLSLRSLNWPLFEFFHKQHATLPQHVVIHPYLKSAIKSLRYSSVKALLDMGAEVEAEFLSSVMKSMVWWRMSGRNYRAPRKEREKVLQLLLERGWPATGAAVEGDDILLKAARWMNSVHVIYLLLMRGANPHKKDEFGHNVFVEAALTGKTERYCSMLREQGQIDARHTEKASNCLVKELLKHGADANTIGDLGWCPLHLASYQGNQDLVLALLEAGADVHARTHDWLPKVYKVSGTPSHTLWRATALHLASMARSPEVVELLLAHGADINSRVQRRSKGVSDLQQESIAEPHERGGRTALQYALYPPFHTSRTQAFDKNNVRTAAVLVAHGADISGAADDLEVEHVLAFREHQSLWEKLRVGISEEDERDF
ncbi:hypothetical protein G7054_g5357 [Neopestalotiopsis clavispora]|nr:hypothetical protein G7054_g5357 [Neopestalotiopsis clavispora]